jgi:hypothetical protein
VGHEESPDPEQSHDPEETPMPALRTSLVALTLGGAVVTTGVVATSATAAPATATAPASLTTSATAAPASTGSGTAGAADDGDDGTHPVRSGLRRWLGSLTDEQRQCLRDAGLTRPVGPLDDEQRAALREQARAAAEGCGVELPFPRARAFWAGVSEEQKQCLRDSGLTRPVGPLTAEERQALREQVRAAAEACGITLPERAPGS